MRYLFISLLFIVVFLSQGCNNKERQQLTPWGTPMNSEDKDTISKGNFNLNDIVSNGELIILTISGPESYYDYHGRGMGLQYLLCEEFAQKIGVSLRVDVCRDTTEMVNKLKKGDADIIAYPLPLSIKGVRFCGASTDNKSKWAVKQDNKELADTLNSWFKPELVAKIKKEESFLLSTKSIVRHVYSPMLDKGGGVISHYDNYFRMYAPIARWDWKLLAAQCYQESCFDPQAKSWAGARGLMQIMPATAKYLGLEESKINDPESNIAAAAKYINELNGHFRDVQNPYERCFFVLASYNAGYFHIRDAMALARKYGKNQYRWDEVKEFVLNLSSSTYYRDPVVKYGYMRGSETYDYVDRIRSRWAQYRGVIPGGSMMEGTPGNIMPHRAKKKYRFDV